MDSRIMYVLRYDLEACPYYLNYVSRYDTLRQLRDNTSSGFLFLWFAGKYLSYGKENEAFAFQSADCREIAKNLFVFLKSYLRGDGLIRSKYARSRVDDVNINISGYRYHLIRHIGDDEWPDILEPIRNLIPIWFVDRVEAEIIGVYKCMVINGGCCYGGSYA